MFWKEGNRKEGKGSRQGAGMMPRSRDYRSKGVGPVFLIWSVGLSLYGHFSPELLTLSSDWWPEVICENQVFLNQG